MLIPASHDAPASARRPHPRPRCLYLQRIKEDVREQRWWACPVGTAIATRGWRGLRELVPLSIAIVGIDLADDTRLRW